MDYTSNLELKKPAYTDPRDIKDVNDNMDILDTAVTNRALKSDAVKNITRNGLTFTATKANGSTFTFTQQDTTYSEATSGTYGLVKTGFSTSAANRNYAVQLSSGKMYVNVPWTDTVYSLPLAANGTRGGVQVGYSTNGKNYAVQLSGEKMYVNVPWTDTTYSTATTSANGLMSKEDKTKLNGIATGANNYSLPLAGNGTRGGAKTGYSTSFSGGNFAVQLDSNEKMYVHVPSRLILKEYHYTYNLSGNSYLAIKANNFAVDSFGGYVQAALVSFESGSTSVNVEYVCADATGTDVMMGVYNTTEFALSSVQANIKILYLPYVWD